MNTTVSQHKQANAIERAFEGIVSSAKKEAVTLVHEIEEDAHHEGKSLLYYIKVYVVIFSSILGLVLIAESFFIK